MKKIFSYIRYWFFIGTNWNFTLAFFTISHEIRGEKKYKVNTIKVDWLKDGNVKGKNFIHSSIYQACNYYVLEKGFDHLSILCKKDNFIDFGCGKGRALAVAAHYGFKNITGIDFSPVLSSIAKKNIDGLKSLYPDTTFNIMCEDVVNYKIPNDQTVFFFFNPFDEVVMLSVVKKILASLKDNPRKIYVMYANSVHKEVFLSAGFEEVYHFREMTYLEMTILAKENSDATNSNA